MWKARTTRSGADEYIRYATKSVFPTIRAIKGHVGEYLLRRDAGDGVELVALVLWESMDAVRRFAGTEPNTAVVEPEAKAVLTSFDKRATHYQVVHGEEMGINKDARSVAPRPTTDYSSVQIVPILHSAKCVT
jgi:hypothetical protein